MAEIEKHPSLTILMRLCDGTWLWGNSESVNIVSNVIVEANELTFIMLKGVKLPPGHSFCSHFVTARS